MGEVPGAVQMRPLWHQWGDQLAEALPQARGGWQQAGDDDSAPGVLLKLDRALVEALCWDLSPQLFPAGPRP